MVSVIKAANIASKAIKFSIAYLSYYVRHSFAPKVNNQSEFATLAKQGVQVFPNFFTPQIIDNIVKDIEATGIEYVPMLEGQDNPAFLWRQYRLNEVAADMSQLTTHALFHRAANAYLGVRSHCSRMMLAQKNIYNQKKDGPTEYYHFDDWKHRLKVMIYLDDVDDTNSPFCYLRRSHNWSWWKLKEDFKFYSNFDRSQPIEGGNVDWTASYKDGCIHSFGKLKGWQEIIVQGVKGTAILFDSRGLHRGQPLVSGCRRVIILHFKTECEDGEHKTWLNRSEVDLGSNNFKK